MRKIEVTFMVGLLILITLVVLGIPIYSNYSVCKTYYTSMNPFLCMASSKTVAIPERQ